MSLTWREARRSELREHLYTTALGLFRARGFEATKVAEITSVAGVSKGTFFNYFPAKSQVLEEWYRRITTDALSSARAQSFGTARAAVVHLLSELASGASADPELYRMKERHVFQDGTLRAAEDRLDGELIGFLREHVEAGIARGELAADLDTRLCTAVILSILTGTAHEWVVARQQFDLAQTLADRIDLLLITRVSG